MAQLSQSIGTASATGSAGATRNASIDAFRLIAAAMVVAGHSNFLCDTESLACLSTIHGGFRLAIPVFLTISGYYFFAAMQADREWTWVKRIGRLYLVWMIIYSPFWLIGPILQGATHDIPENIVFGYYHLWYVVAVAGAALMTIFLSRLGMGWLLAIGLVLFGVGVLIQYALNYGFLPDRLVHHAKNGWLQRNFIFFGFPFFALGYVIAARKIETKVSRSAMIGVLVAGLVLLALEVGSNYVAAGKIHVFELYAAIIIGGPALFMIALKSNWQSRRRNISKFAEAIFLLHILVLTALSSLLDVGSVTMSFLCLAVTAPLAVGLVWLDQRVKGVFL